MQKTAYTVASILIIFWTLAFIVFRIRDIRIHYLLVVAAGIIGTRLLGRGKKKPGGRDLRYVAAILLIILWGISYVYLNITGFYIHILLLAAIVLIIHNIAKSKR